MQLESSRTNEGRCWKAERGNKSNVRGICECKKNERGVKKGERGEGK